MVNTNLNIAFEIYSISMHVNFYVFDAGPRPLRMNLFLLHCPVSFLHKPSHSVLPLSPSNLSAKFS